jgi:GNAT superfamily N-acetyltransferase
MPITIRRASVDDAETVAALVHRLLTELDYGNPIPAQDVYAKTCRRLLAGSDAFAAFLAFDGDERPVGIVNLSECAAVYALGRFGEISELYVAPEQRSAGLGRRLLEQAATYGRSRGWTRLEVGAPDLRRWARTMAFYEAYGFTEVGPRLKLSL